MFDECFDAKSRLRAQAKKLYDLLMSGEDFGEEEHPIVEKSDFLIVERLSGC